MNTVFEIITDTTGNVTVNHKPVTGTTENDVESVYNFAIADASVSNYPVHAVVMLNDQGQVLQRECYKRNPATEPSPEPEPEPEPTPDPEPDPEPPVDDGGDETPEEPVEVIEPEVNEGE